MEKIDRREAIKRTAAIMGCTLSGTLISAVLSGCSNTQTSSGWSPSALTNEQLQVAADLAEVILPATDTPGAKDAKVERFIDRMVSEFYPTAERNLIIDSLDELNRSDFLELNFENQTEFVSQFISNEENRDFFLLFKQTTLMGFFTSEIGATQVLQYDPIPGGYLGCESLEELGGKTWAT
ncbi:MAG: gluconate 2-dehydrogenase subunit 3 family protein [Balneolaceae bacterium]|nr:gluconate 2-dehydrogenase subunit 3 family protein [Balneolaceae bacterium]